MSKDGQSTQRCRNGAENFNRLSKVHERYRRQTDGPAIALWRTWTWVHVL